MQSDKIATLVKSANVNVESYWPSLFAKLAEKRNVGDLIMNIGAGGGAAAPIAVSSSAPAAASAAAPAVEEKKVKLMVLFFGVEVLKLSVLFLLWFVLLICQGLIFTGILNEIAGFVLWVIWV